MRKSSGFTGAFKNHEEMIAALRKHNGVTPEDGEVTIEKLREEWVESQRKAGHEVKEPAGGIRFTSRKEAVEEWRKLKKVRPLPGENKYVEMFENGAREKELDEQVTRSLPKKFREPVHGEDEGPL